MRIAMSFRKIFFASFATIAATTLFFPAAAVTIESTHSPSPGNGFSLRMASFNLHGYHPFQAPRRFWQNQRGELRPAFSSPFFFSWEELTRGEMRRREPLAQLVNRVAPDLLLLQEVAAGRPGEELNCATFEDTTRVGQGELGANTALELQSRLSGYGVLLACRGNRAWVTEADQFTAERMVRRASPEGAPEVVFDHGSNPYPEGILVEGFAILHSNRLRNIHNEARTLQVGPDAENFVYQLAEFAVVGTEHIVVVANVHGGHKLRNFAQSLALRRDINRYLSARHQSKSNVSPNPGEQHLHLVVGGDINEALAHFSEPPQSGSFIPPRTDLWFAAPWELARPGVFDLRSLSPRLRERWRRELSFQNQLPYKGWATVENAEEWINWSLIQLDALLQESRRPEALGGWALMETLQRFFNRCENNCPAPLRDNRIDLIFAPQGSQVVAADEMERHATWWSTEALSDHPFVWAEAVFEGGH